MTITDSIMNLFVFLGSASAVIWPYVLAFGV